MGHSYTSDPVARAPFEFELDGVKFVATGTVTLLDISDLATLAQEDITSVRGAAAVGEIFRAAFEDEYPTFKAHTRKHRTRPERLVEILNDLIEYVSAGPTEPPKPSALGRSGTTGSSVDDLRWPGLPAPRELTQDEIDRVRALLPGGS